MHQEPRGSHDNHVRTLTGFRRPFTGFDEPTGEPHPHRYLHGGVEGTETLLWSLLPDGDQCDGRVLRFPMGGARVPGRSAGSGSFRLLCRANWP